MTEIPTRQSLQPLVASDPRQLGRHRLLGRLGAGGMGVVYLAEGPLGRVAVKTVHSHLAADPQFRIRFQHEVQACFRVRGPYTAELVDFDTTATSPWLATEFVDVPDLEQLVSRSGPLNQPAQLALALGLAEALTTLHAAGIVHRDLKPSNVLCAAEGLKVIDFGIASAADVSGLTDANQLVGTAGWMAPERFEGQTTAAADIYAWAALIGYAASGRPLFVADTPMHLVMQAAHAEPHIEWDLINPKLDALVRAGLQRDPNQRPAASDLRSRLIAHAATQADQTIPSEQARMTAIVTRNWKPEEALPVVLEPGAAYNPGEPIARQEAAVAEKPSSNHHSAPPEPRQAWAAVSHQTTFPATSEGLGVVVRSGQTGAEVNRVGTGTVADEAGLTAGDIIISVGGRLVRDATEIARALRMLGPTQKPIIKWFRDGKYHTAEIPHPSKEMTHNFPVQLGEY